MIAIDSGSSKDIDSWMHLVQKVSSSFSGLETEDALAEHRQTVLDFMDRQEAIVNCPCKKTKCERHGNCDACRAYHTGSKRKRPCERTKNS